MTLFKSISIIGTAHDDANSRQSDRQINIYRRVLDIERCITFFLQVPHCWSLRPTTTKTDLRENQTAGDLLKENPHGLGKRREPCKKITYSRRFWVKEPGHQGKKTDEKCNLCYGNTRLYLFAHRHSRRTGGNLR